MQILSTPSEAYRIISEVCHVNPLFLTVAELYMTLYVTQVFNPHTLTVIQ